MAKTKIKTKTKRPVGRPRICFTYEEAKKIIQSEGVQTKKDYEKWYLYNLPARMPKRPDRSYHRNGFTWHEFLGKQTGFPSPRKSYRTYEDARKYAMSLGFKSKIDWIAFAKTDDRPQDIPSRPDLRYRKSGEWVSWKHFLGYNLAQRHQELVEEVKSTILYIIKVPNRPANVYKINVMLGRAETLVKAQQANQIRIVRCFHIEKMENDWMDIVNQYCTPYYNAGEDNEFSSNNIALLISALSQKYYSVILP